MAALQLTAELQPLALSVPGGIAVDGCHSAAETEDSVAVGGGEEVGDAHSLADMAVAHKIAAGAAAAEEEEVEAEHRSAAGAGAGNAWVMVVVDAETVAPAADVVMVAVDPETVSEVALSQCSAPCPCPLHQEPLKLHCLLHHLRFQHRLHQYGCPWPGGKAQHHLGSQRT